jgi:hypothetical protein
MGSDFFASDQPFEMPGRSCFLQAGGRVFHTYSQYARGLESTGGSYYFLDLTALGRQEELGTMPPLTASGASRALVMSQLPVSPGSAERRAAGVAQ